MRGIVKLQECLDGPAWYAFFVASGVAIAVDAVGNIVGNPARTLQREGIAWSYSHRWHAQKMISEAQEKQR